MRRGPKVTVAIACGIALLAAAESRGETPGGALPAASASPAVVALVDNQPINAAEVERLLRQALGRQELAPEARPLAEAQALQQRIGQVLVLRHLRAQEPGRLETKVEEAMAALKAEAERQKLPFEQHLQARGLTEAELRDELAWQLAWDDYLRRQLTDPRLQQHFDQHRRDFDGSQVRARQIFWRVPATPGTAQPAELQARLREAERVRGEILAGRLDFAEAARKYSEAPSREQGGDVGFFPRRGVMPEALAAAAFQLEPGEVSRPVVTPFGVHLVQVSEVRPGEKPWHEVRGELRHDLARRLFEELAENLRREARVEFTGRMSYFHPQTGELVRGAR